MALMTVELLVNEKIIALGGEPEMARNMAARVAELDDQPAPPNDGSIVQVDCTPERAIEIVGVLKVEFPTTIGVPIDNRLHELELEAVQH